MNRAKSFHSGAHEASEPGKKNPGGRLGGTWRFCLYVAGDSPHSQLALRNLEMICAEFLKGRCQIDVIDVLEQPNRALEDGVVVTPTLVKLSPPPTARLMGNLSDLKTVLLVIGLQKSIDREESNE